MVVLELEEMTSCYGECSECKGKDCLMLPAVDYQHENLLEIPPLEVIFSDYIPYDYEFEWC